ncbi:hypothetical protein [Nocardia africana]|nr:hypothetical protein [Nocardia africana]MCC3316762.1 hypothetical protein [Nocardia africana]
MPTVIGVPIIAPVPTVIRVPTVVPVPTVIPVRTVVVVSAVMLVPIAVLVVTSTVLHSHIGCRLTTMTHAIGLVRSVGTVMWCTARVRILMAGISIGSRARPVISAGVAVHVAFSCLAHVAIMRSVVVRVAARIYPIVIATRGC